MNDNEPEDDEFYELADDADNYVPPPPPPFHGRNTSSSGGIGYTQVACTQCGYNLTGIAIGSHCPECGASVNQSFYAATSAATSGKAVTSLVLGIISIVTVCCCPVPILGIIGLVFGILALNEIKTGNFASSSRGMALAGIWCSSISIVLDLGYWAINIVMSL